MYKALSAGQRLIIPGDFKPPVEGDQSIKDAIHDEVIKLAQDLRGLDTTVKLNSALRLLGYDIMHELIVMGVRTFADLKLNDIPETVRTDGLLLAPYSPEIVTVMCSAGPDAIKALYDVLPNTEVVGVTVLTSFNQDTCEKIYGYGVEAAVLRLVETIIKQTPVQSFVCSPSEVPGLIKQFGSDLRLITPGIRPLWTVVKNDDQNPERIMTPQNAIKAGSTRLVVGRPILNAEDRRVAAERTIEEITLVV